MYSPQDNLLSSTAFQVIEEQHTPILQEVQDQHDRFALEAEYYTDLFDWED